MARVSLHAFTAAVALLFGLGLGACGSSGRPPVDAGGDAVGAADGDIEDAAPDGPDQDGGDVDTDAGTEDAAADADPDTAGPDAADGEVAPPVCGSCAAADWGTPSPIGTIPSVQLPELSGLAASRLHPGTLYAHNDSGDSARFFAMDELGRLLTQIDLPGATSIDWEDVAVARCPTGWCVFVADIGDNDLNRTECAIYRVPEPETLPTNGSTITASFERLPFVYPDGRHNAETVLVDSQSQRIFVVTKEETGPSRVYELPTPLTPTVRATLVFVGTLSVPATAGPIISTTFS